MMGSSVHQADHLTTISAQCLQVALGSSKFARSRRPSAVVSTHTRRPRSLSYHVATGKKTPGATGTGTGR